MLTEKKPINQSVVIVVFLHGNQFICTYILLLYIMHIYNKQSLSFTFIVCMTQFITLKTFFPSIIPPFCPTENNLFCLKYIVWPILPHDNIIEWRIILKCSAINSLLGRYTFYITLIQKMYTYTLNMLIWTRHFNLLIDDVLLHI